MSANLLGQITTRKEWLAVLKDLPELSETNGRIPAFFFAHGSPTLLWPESVPNPRLSMFGDVQKPDGLLVNWLKDFGQVLLEKYKPKGIVVFSAHWETGRERLVTDYGDENPLLMDYYGFPKELYDITWRSRGSKALSERVVSAFRAAGMPARTTPITEHRGEDGRPTQRKYHNGLDHGVFVPFKLMFPDTTGSFDVPVVQVSIGSDYTPEHEYEIGKAVKGLRDEGILVLSGGLTIHTFRDLSSFNEKTAKPLYHDWNNKIIAAIQHTGTQEERRQAIFNLSKEPEFRLAHPREDHFAPLWVAQGVGDGGEARLLSGMYGATSVAWV